MKKFIVPISVTVLIIGLVAVYFMFFSSTNVYEAIPDSAVAVIEINDWNKLSQELHSKGSGAALVKTEAWTRLDDQVAFLGQMVGSNSALKAAVYNSRLTISAHLTSADDFGYLFSMPVKKMTNDDVLRAFSANLNVTSVNKRTFKAIALVDVAMKDGRHFSFTIIHDILSFSFNSFLTETAITALTGDGNLAGDKVLCKVLKKTEPSEAARLFINFKKAAVIFPVVFRSQKAGLLKDVSTAQSWGGYSISLSDDQINMAGFGFVGEENKEAAGFNVLSNTIWNNIPDNAAYINAGFNHTDAHASGKPDASNILIADFKDWPGEAHAFVTLEPLREDFNDQNMFIIQVKDEVKAIVGLKHLISIDGSKAMPTDTFMHVEIYNLKDGSVLNHVFGSSFTTFGNVLFGISNHVAIFCNNLDILKFTLEKIGKGETINKEAGLLKTIGDTKSGTGAIYMNTTKSALLLSGLIREGSTLQNYLATLNGISVVSTVSGEWNSSRVTLVTGNGNSTNGGLLWKTKLLAWSDFTPQIVVNKETNEKEIFTQDTANNIYLISKSGEIIFTRNIGEKIIGGVHQLALHDDGKYEYIFNTSAHVFMIDRAGNDVASYPLRIGSQASAGLTCVSNGNRSYYYVPCLNGRIYGYEATGKPLSGWSPRKGVGVMTKPLLPFTYKKNELMLAFNASGKLMLLNAKGDIKWSVDNLPVTAQSFSLVQTQDDFVVLNAAGTQLIEISSDGNDKLKPLVDSAFSFAATATSDTGYRYFFSSLHDIRSYDETGKFKNAVSLKTSTISGIEVQGVFEERSYDKYLLVKDSDAKRVSVYDLNLKQVAEYAVTNAGTFTITDLFDRKELIGVQPDGSGSIECYRIR